MAPRVSDPWVDALLAGDSAASVLRAMRAHYEAAARKNGRSALNKCSLRTAVTDVKRRVLEVVREGAEYREGIRALRAAARGGASAECARQVDAFLDMSISVQSNQKRKIASACRARGGGAAAAVEDAAVLAAFDALRILPANLVDFRVEYDEMETCKRRSSTNLLTKPKFVVPDAGATLREATRVVRGAADEPVHRVIACLMLASGRRMTEVLNCESTFERLPSGYAHGCLFSGQLKTRSEIRTLRFKIPLLVPFDAFEGALAVVRAWQGDVDAVRKLTNEQVKNRYQPGLHRYLQKDGSDIGGAPIRRPHTMRAIYARLVLRLFDWGLHRDARVLKYCLGHTDEMQSKHYDHVEIKRAPRKHAFGAFPLADAELRRVEEVMMGEG